MCCMVQARLAEEDGVSNAVNMISQHMANAAVPAQEALQNLASQTKLQANSHPNRQVKAQLASEAGATFAQASTESADASTDPVKESGAGPIQVGCSTRLSSMRTKKSAKTAVAEHI
jgi:hypothetical protein